MSKSQFYFFITLCCLISISLCDSESLSISPETENENKVELSQVGHLLVSKTYFKDDTLMRKHFSNYAIIESSLFEAFMGYVGTHLNGKTLIVSFRGTYKSFQNFITDIIIIKKKNRWTKRLHKYGSSYWFHNCLQSNKR